MQKTCLLLRFIFSKIFFLSKITSNEQINKKQIYIIGSACTDKFNDKSDIDLFVSFKDLTVEPYTDNYFELHDIQESINSINDYPGNNRDFNAYKSKKLLRRGIERELEIIGEATTRIKYGPFRFKTYR